MMILIRHQKVKSRYITKQLAKTEVDTYKPKDASNLTIPIHFGFLPKKFDPTQESYGIMMYHRNRLIKVRRGRGVRGRQHLKRTFYPQNNIYDVLEVRQEYKLPQTSGF